MERTRGPVTGNHAGEDAALEPVYRELFDLVPTPVFVHNSIGDILIANRAAADLAGYPADEFSRRTIFDLFSSDDLDRIWDEVEQLEQQGTLDEPVFEARGPVPVHVTRGDGRRVPVELTLRSTRLARFGDELIIQGVMRETTEELRASQELDAIREVMEIIAGARRLEDALAGVLDVLAERRGYDRASVWTVSPDGRELLLRASSGAAPERVPITIGVLGRVARDRRPAFLPDVSADPDYIANNPDIVSEICAPILRDGRLIGLIDIEADAGRRLQESDLTFLESLATQIAGLMERAELYQHLERQATTDAITGLPNRQAFQARLEETVEAKTGQRVSVLIAGVDGFKGTNELYGHAVADDILFQIGQVFAVRMRGDQFLARYTSDQFAILLPGADRDQAVVIAENLRIAVAMQLFTAAEQVEQLTVSIGATTCPDDARDAEGALQAADHALYLAKRAGNNQTFQSNAAFATLAAAHGRITDLLRQAPRETLALLVRAMDQRLPERAGHSERVTRYALAIARNMEIDEEQLQLLRLAAYIHDIGMMSLPDALLRKPSALSLEERSLLRNVPAVARNLLSQLDMPEFVLRSVVHLRERYDGGGFPSGLAGEDIPLGARIIAVADAIDAMTSVRAHREPLSLDEALDAVNRQAGKQFDPRVAAAARPLRDMLPIGGEATASVTKELRELPIAIHERRH